MEIDVKRKSSLIGKAPVLKTGVTERSCGFKSYLFRQFSEGKPGGAWEQFAKLAVLARACVSSTLPSATTSDSGK